MILQPYLSMDALAIAMLTPEQAQLMTDIAKDYPAIITRLEGKHPCQQGSVQQDSSPADASLHINPLIFHYHVTGSYLQIQGIRPHAVARAD